MAVSSRFFPSLARVALHEVRVSSSVQYALPMLQNVKGGNPRYFSLPSDFGISQNVGRSHATLLPNVSGLISALQQFVQTTIGGIVQTASFLLELLLSNPIVTMLVLATGTVAITVAGYYFYVYWNGPQNTNLNVELASDSGEFFKAIKSTFDEEKENYECPISYLIMKDPVDTLCCSKTYDRESITPFLDKNCPNCNAHLGRQLHFNRSVNNQIQIFRKKYENLFPEEFCHLKESK